MKLVAPEILGHRMSPVALQARTTQRLVDRQGLRISCLDGQVWITQHQDPRDIILKPGQCFVLDRQGLAVVFALADAIVTLGASPNAAPCTDVSTLAN